MLWETITNTQRSEKPLTRVVISQECLSISDAYLSNQLAKPSANWDNYKYKGDPFTRKRVYKKDIYDGKIDHRFRGEKTAR